MKKKKTIVIVEDDLLSAEYLKEILIKENYSVLDIIDTDKKAIQKFKTIQPNIILIDIMLKGQLSGSEIAIEIKHFHPECKIVFLTAFAEPEMIDYAVESNACAYLMKPYREKEILATIKVVLSQDHIPSKTKKKATLIPLKNHFFFDEKHRRLYKDGHEIPLTSKKVRLIELLAKNKNNTVSNEQICMYVWNEIKSNSTLRSLVYRFRSDINDDIITNVNGVGYSINS